MSRYQDLYTCSSISKCCLEDKKYDITLLNFNCFFENTYITLLLSPLSIEPHHEKTSFLHIRKQRGILTAL